MICSEIPYHNCIYLLKFWVATTSWTGVQTQLQPQKVNDKLDAAREDCDEEEAVAEEVRRKEWRTVTLKILILT